MSLHSRVLTVVVAGGGAAWETEVLDDIRQSSGLYLRRQCLDVAELLSLSGLCDVAVVSTDLVGLDLESVLALERDGVRVVGVGDPHTGRRLGIALMVEPDQLESCLAAPVEDVLPAEPGPVFAVWGPHGAPGRSVIAASVAAELARSAKNVCLVDADPRGGAQAQMHALLDDASGLVAACRSANRGDLATIAAHAVAIQPGLRLLTGVVHADMWEQVRESLFPAVLRAVAEAGDAVVIDLGPGLDAQTRHALAIADRVIVVGRADPVGLARLVRSLHDLSSVAGSSRRPLVVMNQMRSGAAWSPGDVSDAVARLAGVRPDVFIPLDFATLDTAAVRGTIPAEVASDSPFATGVRELVDRLGTGVGARISRR
ncbi:MAG: CpaE family protein [Aeromicrobium sp.]